jgi:hypothetical protein
MLRNSVTINNNSQPGQLKNTVHTQTTIHQKSSLLKWATAALALPWEVLLAVTFQSYATKMKSLLSHLLNFL